MRDPLDNLRRLMSPAISAQPDLNEADKELLRSLSREDGPLYKIIKSTLDFSDEMREVIASAPLDKPEGVELARQLQLRRNAALEFVKWFVQLYDVPAARPQRKDHSRG